MKISSYMTVGFGLLANVALGQDHFTFETTERLFSTADLNGDALLDAVVIDRLTGVATLGFQFASGSYSWSAGHATGASPVSCLTVGRLNTIDYYGVTTPTLGRIIFSSATTSGAQPSVLQIFPKLQSPQSMAFFPISSTTTPELLVVGDKGVGATARYGYELRPGINASAGPIWERSFGINTTKVASVRVKTATPPRVLEYYGPTLYIEGVTLSGLTSGPGVLGGALTNASTQFAVGNFDGTAYSQFFFYDAGTATVRTAKVTEPTAGTYAWGALSTFSLPQTVKLLVPMPTAGGGMRLGAIYADGSVALLNYAGSGTPTLYRTLSAAGNPFADLLLPAGPDAAILLRGGAWLNFRTAAADPVVNQFSGTAPLNTNAARVSNVVFLSAEAFAKVDSSVLATGQVREWTTAATGGGTAWNITSVVSSGANGLGGATINTRTAPVGTTATLLNQVRTNASVYFTDAGPGLPVGDVVMAPPAGVYPPGQQPPGAGAPAAWIVGAIATLPASLLYDPAPAGGEFVKISPYLTVTLQPTRSGDAVWYRVNDAAWNRIPGAGQIELYANATIESYSTDGTSRSATRRSVYTFAAPAGLTVQPGTDGDADGLSDLWEKNFGATNPLADNDGDGAPNLAEYQAGTDPQDALSKPPPLLALRIQEFPTMNPPRQFRIAWDTSLGSVVLESSTSLASGPWQPISSGIVVAGAETYHIISLSAGSPLSKFFRIRRP